MRVKWDVEFPEGVHEIKTPHLTCNPMGGGPFSRAQGFICRVVHPHGHVLEEVTLGTNQEVSSWMKLKGDEIRRQLEEMGVRFVDRKAVADS